MEVFVSSLKSKGEMTFMEGIGCYFEGSAIAVFRSAKNICDTLKFEIMPKELFFTPLYSMPGSPLYNWFVKKGMTEEEINKKRREVYEKYVYGESYVTKVLDYMLEDPYEDELLELKVDEDIVKLIKKAAIIAKTEYHKDSVGIEELTEAFAEEFEDTFYKIMKTYVPSFGKRGSLNCLDYVGGNDVIEFSIPVEMKSYIKVLNDDYSPDSTMCHICGREEETKALTKVLMKRTKRNAVLIGEPGVGKTALIEKFVWQIVTGNCPERFKNSIVLSLDVNSIVAGTRYRGMAEERFKDLIAFLESNPNVILFIDEIHLLLGAGACSDGDLDLANALKPILARGDTQVVGATTLSEYEKYFSKDGALKRRFECIVVNEPKSTEVYNMIKNQIKLLEETHHTTISRKLVNTVIFKASCFNYETHNPDRTLDLLDKTMVCAELAGRSRVTMQDILENFKVNQKKFDKMSERVKRSTAYHEAGHYLAHKFSPELIEDELIAVSIMPAENYLGINVFEVDPDATPSYNRDYFIQQIGTKLAGRVAEKMYSNELTGGATSDLTAATKTARDVITRYGLDEEFTSDRVFLKDNSSSMYTDKVIDSINDRIDKLLKEAREYIEKLLLEKQEYLDALADELVKKGMLTSQEIEKMFEKIEKNNRADN